MRFNAGLFFTALREAYRSAERAAFISVQARRCDTPRVVANATAARRACTLTIFCGDFFHHFDLEITLGDQLLQPRILLLELLEPAQVVDAGGAEFLAPGINSLLADLVPLGDDSGLFTIVRRKIAVAQRFLIRLTPQERDHLLNSRP